MGSFVIAESPDSESTLPSFLRFKVAGEAPIVKPRQTWPRASTVYRHRADDWPADATLVEEAPVRAVAVSARTPVSGNMLFTFH